MESGLNLFYAGTSTSGQAPASPSSSKKSKFRLATLAAASAKRTRRQGPKKPRKGKATVYDENIGFFSVNPQLEMPRNAYPQPEAELCTPGISVEQLDLTAGGDFESNLALEQLVSGDSWSIPHMYRNRVELLVPLAREWVSSTICQEMEIAKPMLRMCTTEITTEYTSEWDGTKIMEGVAAVTPTLTEVLRAATSNSEGVEQSKKDRVTARHLIASQLHYVRLRNSARVALGIGIVTWSDGASRQLLALMNKVGLSPSYQSVQNAVDTLAERSVEQGYAIAEEPHTFACDNFQSQTSISDFVEQTLKATPKVQHGSFPFVYKPLRPVKEDIALGPILKRVKQARLLQLGDLRPSRDSVCSCREQTTVNIAKVLIKYVPGFAALKDHPSLQNPPRRPIPDGQKNVFAPLRVTTIEEASCSGNRLVHKDIYISQLQKDPKTLSKRAVVAIDDQMTNTRNRETFLSQALNGLLLDARELECGDPLFEKYAKSKPSANDLLELALQAQNKYAVPTPNYAPIQKPKDPDAGAKKVSQMILSSRTPNVSPTICSSSLSSQQKAYTVALEPPGCPASWRLTAGIGLTDWTSDPSIRPSHPQHKTNVFFVQMLDSLQQQGEPRLLLLRLWLDPGLPKFGQVQLTGLLGERDPQHVQSLSNMPNAN
ncbi:hypothetical protein BKA70DRAFT_1479679 [Coprinopsis sp. MPI-PUGE-AT-0042]|nr:hypothetical protein BKA70DRAFT_1479679 [Coprinopsis sp. MPI-PUGE-AT-0042]